MCEVSLDRIRLLRDQWIEACNNLTTFVQMYYDPSAPSTRKEALRDAAAQERHRLEQKLNMILAELRIEEPQHATTSR